MQARRALVCGAVGLGALAAFPAAQSEAPAERMLQRTLGFSAGQLRELRAGRTVMRTLDTPVREELAHIGAVYIEASAARFVERFRDVERFERGPGIPQIGRFSNPPRLADLDALTLPPADVAALRTCRPGDCGVKLPTAAMARFREGVDWSSPDASRQANTVLRGMLFDLVRGYQREGTVALGVYDDGAAQLAVADQFRALLASGDPLPTPVPDLLAYLDGYPNRRPPGAEDLFYWTVVDFGLKPTIRVNRVVIQPLEASAASGVAYAIAIKQLYASHYFHTTLELRFLIDDDRPGRDGSWLISLTRSRSDGLTGVAGLFVRPVVNSRSRDAVRKYLEHVQRQIARPQPAAAR